MSFSHGIIFRRKYKFIVISIECLSASGLIDDLLKLMKSNMDIKIILISSTNWPLETKPLKLSDAVFIAGRIDLLLILNNYINNNLTNFLSVTPFLCFSRQEREVLQMIMNQEAKGKICNKLRIKNKTISSHISNIKKKASAISYQQLNLVFRVKYFYLKDLK